MTPPVSPFTAISLTVHVPPSLAAAQWDQSALERLAVLLATLLAHGLSEREIVQRLLVSDEAWGATIITGHAVAEVPA